MIFDEIPNDKDTEVLFNKYITIHGLLAVQQQWKWDGIMGKSIIFTKESLKEISPDKIHRSIQLLQKKNQKITISENNGFVFYNYYFSV